MLFEDIKRDIMLDGMTEFRPEYCIEALYLEKKGDEHTCLVIAPRYQSVEYIYSKIEKNKDEFQDVYNQLRESLSAADGVYMSGDMAINMRYVSDISIVSAGYSSKTANDSNSKYFLEILCGTRLVLSTPCETFKLCLKRFKEVAEVKCQLEG